VVGSRFLVRCWVRGARAEYLVLSALCLVQDLSTRHSAPGTEYLA